MEPRDGENTDVLVRPKTKKKLARPKMYRVLLHNDDYTPRDFVVMILISIFGKSESDAHAIMLKAHKTGMSVAGVYPFSVAETKVAETLEAAEKASFPLMCSMEPESDEDDGGGSSE